MTFDEWLKEGYDQGWVGPAVCYTHDGLPMSEGELWQFEEGNDPCMHVLRLYEDSVSKQQIENDHGPSVWRASNAGLTSDEKTTKVV